MPAGVRMAAATVTSPQASPVGPLRERLGELMRLVMTVPDEVYAARTARTSGTVGAHVRHVLDHISALLGTRPSGVLCYDHRARGTAVETMPSAAVREMMRLDAALERWSARRLDEPVAVESVVARSGESATSWSTLGRELAFVLNHTIHHQAMIALQLEGLGHELPDARFGYAPSTPTHG